MPQDTLRSPVIIVGMGHSGTTLVAEMLHKAGTPMFAGEQNADYDNGIRYERPLTKQLNTEIFGLAKKPKIIEQLWQLPLRPLNEEQVQRILDEVGAAPWGFKDPRTTITYPMWVEAFPEAVNLSVYRRHEEVLRSFYRDRASRISSLRRMRRGLNAWIHYNEKLLEYLEQDRAAGRACVLVKYEEMMEHKALVAQVSEVIGVPLFDARNPKLRRNRVTASSEKLLYKLGTLGHEKDVAALYEKLDAARLMPRPDEKPQQSTLI